MTGLRSTRISYLVRCCLFVRFVLQAIFSSLPLFVRFYFFCLSSFVFSVIVATLLFVFCLYFDRYDTTRRTPCIFLCLYLYCMCVRELESHVYSNVIHIFCFYFLRQCINSCICTVSKLAVRARIQLTRSSNMYSIGRTMNSNVCCSNIPFGH